MVLQLVGGLAQHLVDASVGPEPTLLALTARLLPKKVLRGRVVPFASSGHIEFLKSHVAVLLALSRDFGLSVLIHREVALDAGNGRASRTDPALVGYVGAVAKRLGNFETTFVFVRILH